MRKARSARTLTAPGMRWCWPRQSRLAVSVTSVRSRSRSCIRACSARTCSMRPRVWTIRISAPGTTPKRWCATSTRGRSASIEGIVIGDSRTGAIDKIDGPYYFFRLIKKMREMLPPWMPTIGLEGGRLNLVPVDWVAAALDHIAHKSALDGHTFHLTDPAPQRIGEVLNLFARAGHAPRMTMRIDARIVWFHPRQRACCARQPAAAAADRQGAAARSGSGCQLENAPWMVARGSFQRSHSMPSGIA